MLIPSLSAMIASVNAPAERNLPRLIQYLKTPKIQNSNPIHTPFGGIHQCGYDWYI